MTHSPEPWKVEEEGPYYLDNKGWQNILDANNEVIILDNYNDGGGFSANERAEEGINFANANRIVACVNACRGIPNEELEEFINHCLWRDKSFLEINDSFIPDWLTQALELRK